LLARIGNEPVKVLWDEGSSKSLITLQWLQNAKLADQIDNRKRYTLKGFNDTSNQTPWMFHIVDKLAEDVFVGVDFACFHKTIMDRGNNTLTIYKDSRSELIHLDQEDRYIRLKEKLVIPPKTEEIIAIDRKSGYEEILLNYLPSSPVKLAFEETNHSKCWNDYRHMGTIYLLQAQDDAR
jgi:hypothetical protein